MSKLRVAPIVVLVLASAALARPAPAAAAWSEAVATPRSEARLLSEVAEARPGSAFWVGLRLGLAEGWHTYWRNPGDSGLAPSIAWELPEGVAAGEIRWPTPRRFRFGSQSIYGYAEEVVLLTRVSVLPGVRRPEPLAPLVLKASAQWLVCADICVPESARLTLALPLTTGPPGVNADARDLIARFAEQVPRNWLEGVDVQAFPDRLELVLPRPETGGAAVTALSFFPSEYGIVEPGAEQRWRDTGRQLLVDLQRGELRQQRFERIEGVLHLKLAGGSERAYLVRAVPR